MNGNENNELMDDFFVDDDLIMDDLNMEIAGEEVEIVEEAGPTPLDRFQLVTPRGSQMPIERSGQRIFADDNYVYLIGGYNPSPERTLSDAWRFNRLTHSWQQCTMADATFPLPDTLASFSLVSRGPGPDFNSGSNEAYIFGGTKVPFGGQSNTNRFYWVRIDRDGRVHLKLQTVHGEEPLPAQYGQGMCRRLETNQAGRVREVVYIVGGTTGHEFNMDVWKLQRPAGADLDQSWDAVRLNRRIPDEFGRYRLELVAHDDKLYTFGGSISDRFFVRLDELTIFDLKSNQFEQLPTKADPEHGFPRERSCHALVHRRKLVYLLGGRDQEMTIFDTVWRLDLDSLQWAQLRTSLPVPVFFNSAAITPDDCIYVFGGVTIDPPAQEGQAGQNRRVNCLQRMWLRPPSLRQIASDQLTGCISSQQLNVLTKRGVRLGDAPELASFILCPPPTPTNEFNESPKQEGEEQQQQEVQQQEEQQQQEEATTEQEPSMLLDALTNISISLLLILLFLFFAWDWVATIPLLPSFLIGVITSHYITPYVRRLYYGGQ